jgi:RimJ/RimL family protein N-acetyltransferase
MQMASECESGISIMALQSITFLLRKYISFGSIYKRCFISTDLKVSSAIWQPSRYKISRIHPPPSDCPSTMTEVTDSARPFFETDWSVHIPLTSSSSSTPAHLVVSRMRTADIDDWIPLVIDPKNNELQDNAEKVWDEAAVQSFKETALKRITETPYLFLEVLIRLDGALIGYGGLFAINGGYGDVDKPGSKNGDAGIVLTAAARGLGVGTAVVRTLVQVGFDCGLDSVTSGTMLINAPMRKVFKKLGAIEEEKIIELPGRGIVGELEVTFNREKWEPVVLDITR